MNRTAFITPLSSVSETDLETVGTVRDENNKRYKYVKYVEGTGSLDVAAGDAVVYTDGEEAEVTADVSDVAGLVVAGVILGTVDETARYIWIQTRGPVTLNAAVTSGGDGVQVTAGGDKLLAKAAESDTGADLPHVCGYVIDNANNRVNLLCPD